MHNWMRGAVIAIVASAATAIVVSQMNRNPVAGQTPDTKLLRTADGKPNLNGIWQAIGTAHWDLQDHQARSGPVCQPREGNTESRESLARQGSTRQWTSPYDSTATLRLPSSG